MKYAVFTVSTPVYEPEIAVQRIKEFGYDGVEWRVLDQEPSTAHSTFWNNNQATLPLQTLVKDAPKWKALSDGAGLEVPSLGTYVSCDEPEAVDLAMRGAAAMGVKQLRVRVSGYDGLEPFLPIWERNQAQYKDVAALAKQHGVKALVELHHRSITPSASAGRRFVDGFDPVHVGVIHDVGNMVYEGFETPRLGLEVLGPYLAHVHIKNSRWFPEKYNTDGSVSWKCDAAQVHKGVIDMRQLLTALHGVGYDGWIGLEDFSLERQLDDRLRDNLTYLKTVETETRAGSGS